MRHPDYGKRISDISEADFWRSLDVKKARGDSGLFARAVRAGRKGGKLQAYGLLAQYHGQRLQTEWAYLRNAGAPPAVHAAKQTAEDVLKHRIFYCPTASRRYGKKIDWNTPASGSIIDSFYWYTPLLQAYIKRPLEKYRRALCDLVVQYYNARHGRVFPQEHCHPVYTGLSASIKLRHILPAYVALAVNAGLDPSATAAFLKLSLGLARALCRRETDFVLSNQTITNAEGFGMFACLFPEFEESAAFCGRAVERILQNLEKGFLPDGGYYERSFDYTIVALANGANAVKMFERSAQLAPAIRGRIDAVFKKSGVFLAKTLAPGEYAPPYADGNIAKKPALLQHARDYFDGRELPYFGVDRSRSYLLPDSGFAVMRQGGGRDDAYVFFSFGRCDLWHCHQDCLMFDLWRYGRPLLMEAGRFDTYFHPMSRLFRMPEMHNTPTIEGQVWDERRPELWRGEDVSWVSTPEVDYVSAAHRAFRGNMPVLPQAQDYRIRRCVVFVKKQGYLLVHDSVTNGGKAPVGVIAQNWHSPAPFRVIAPGCACTTGKTGVLLQTTVDLTLRRAETRADYLANEVKADVAFPERHALRWLRWADGTTGGPQGFVTVVFPFRGRPPKISVRTGPLKGGRAWQAEQVTVHTPAGKDVFVLNPDRRPGVFFNGRHVTGAGMVFLQGRKDCVRLAGAQAAGSFVAPQTGDG